MPKGAFQVDSAPLRVTTWALFRPTPRSLGQLFSVRTMHPFHSCAKQREIGCWVSAEPQEAGLPAIAEKHSTEYLESRQALRLSLLGTSPWERKLQSAARSQKLETRASDKASLFSQACHSV